MSIVEVEESLEKLMSDSRLVQLCELQRTGDEVLDVIKLSENQHSNILAWMLDAKEGHGQGDEILRDLLVCASTKAADDHCGLDGRSTTARFFAAWPPSRIRTTSFGAAFTARELGMNANERVDLFVIDAQNKFILLIENKAGAAHSEEQLNNYRTCFNELVAANSKLRSYDQVYIALDREFDGESAASRPAANYWLHLGYEWLKTSATRALMHVGRGNAAARLVVSYCNRQTDWEDPDEDKCTKLAADLHQAYPEALKYLLGFSRGRLERDWLVKKDNEAEPYKLFILQNKGAVGLLKETQGMASVKAAILSRISSLSKENIRYKRTWLDICPSRWEDFEGESWWPVFLQVWYSDVSQSKYTLALCWAGRHARTEQEAETLRNWLASIEPEFERFGDSQWRRVIIGRSLSMSELLSATADLDKRLEKVVVI